MSNYLMIDGNKIGISNETALNFEEQFGKKEKRFYRGERFVKTSSGDEYVLAEINNHPVLISMNTGVTKNGVYKSIRFQNDKKYRFYVTKLPTTYPGYFGLDKKYGGYDNK